MLQEVLAQKDWIIEGVYYAWTAETFAQADAICDRIQNVYFVSIFPKLLQC